MPRIIFLRPISEFEIRSGRKYKKRGILMTKKNKIKCDYLQVIVKQTITNSVLVLSQYCQAFDHPTV